MPSNPLWLLTDNHWWRRDALVAAARSETDEKGEREMVIVCGTVFMMADARQELGLKEPQVKAMVNLLKVHPIGKDFPVSTSEAQVRFIGSLFSIYEGGCLVKASSSGLIWTHCYRLHSRVARVLCFGDSGVHIICSES